MAVASDFRETLETIRSEEASVQRLFGGDGASVRQQRRSGDYERRLLEAATFMSEVYSGRRPVWHLKEVLGTGDFANLFGDVIDRQLLGVYQEIPATYRSYARISTVADFRTVKRFAVDGSETVLGAVGQTEEYPEGKLTDTVYSYSVSKYGRRVPISWEAMVDDDLGALQTLPTRLARAARRSEEKFATGLFADANGPHASFYTSGNKNLINATNSGAPFTAVNPPLSIAALQQAYATIANLKDTEGEPIAVDGVILVVPPSLETLAMNILNSTELWITGDSAGGTTNTQVHVANWMRQRTRLEVNYYLPVVSTTNGNTSWYLFATPSTGRPALEMGFLRGHEIPELFVKHSNAQRVGGVDSDPMNGDFETDVIAYKVRHVFGGVRLDPRASVASNGSGS